MRRHLNRELSWLDFEERVLDLAEDPSVPLLERAKFHAIFAENLDQFFQVRVAGLKDQEAAGLGAPLCGEPPTEQLAAIRDRTLDLVGRAGRIFVERTRPELAEHGIAFCDWAALDDADRAYLVELFEEQVYPVLNPLAADAGRPFPYVPDLTLNIAVVARDPVSDEPRFGVVAVPPVLNRFVLLPDGRRLVCLEQLIAVHLNRLFPGMEVVAHHVFRVTRNADFELGDEEADDLLAAVELELRRRRFGRAVRLEIDAAASGFVIAHLTRELRLTGDDVYAVDGPLGLSGLWRVHELVRPELKAEPWAPVTAPELASVATGERSMFDVIAERDVLVHHPYDLFTTSVEALVEEAADDPSVLAIKQTLYRTSGSPIVNALARAAESGKQVVAVVELKARFDEEANIGWARRLERAGVHVVYGFADLKTHAKTTLVVREEGGHVVRYSHVGTGNYNPRTARLYEDLGLLSADPDLGADLTELFNYLTGYSRHVSYQKLLVAPLFLREAVIGLIEEQARPGGEIVMKMNSLVDEPVIDALYAASQAGARIDLVVRGICCLRPGVTGLSDSITVRSIVGRYLEHSRIYAFGSGDDRRYFIGSADLMPRNFDRRVEALTPVTAPDLRGRLQEILDVNLADDTRAWQLGPDATWTKVPTERGVNTHRRLQELAAERARSVQEVAPAREADRRVLAAGGLVLRHGGDGLEVLVVHRPKREDWSFPKGKLDPGETFEACAVREVEEETGMRCILGTELPSTEYVDRYGRPKVVRYWAMQPVGGEFRPNDEVDAIRWLTPPDAKQILTYDRDRAVLDGVGADR